MSPILVGHFVVVVVLTKTRTHSVSNILSSSGTVPLRRIMPAKTNAHSEIHGTTEEGLEQPTMPGQGQEVKAARLLSSLYPVKG